MTQDDHLRAAAKAAQGAHRAARWSQRLATVQLWLILGPLVLLALVCAGCGINLLIS